ncbi:MAG: hypothetical protein JXK95_01900, partial [Bacteroidales bacterium]|nr:hypothetical protein [Bacteroidales bacterium]
EKALAEQAAREKALAEQAAREKALAEQAAREKALAEQAARQKAIDEGYKNAVTLANMAFTQKQYSSAREQYQKALTFKPDDVFARNKIEEVNRLIEEENKRLAAVELREKQYKDAIASADRLYQAKDHQGAISGYRQALNIKPGDTYAQQRITDIENAIAAERAERQRALAAEQAAREKALAEEQARKKKYDEVISKADNYFASEEYSNAKTSFGEALRIMPDETYPKQKIVEIDKILAELEKQKLANQARQKQYDNFISLGDKAFEGHNYTVAKGNYQKALNVIPDSPYPKQKLARIEEIEKLLAQQKAQTAQQTTVKSAGTQKIASAVPLAQLNFKDDTERDNYLNELKKKYPEGITVEIYKEKYRETRRYIVVRDNVASEFRDVLIKTYGGHEYTMNGKPVTQLYFGTQVKSRPGEYYKETIFE